MDFSSLPVRDNKPEKTLDQKWDDWERRQRINGPSDEEIAREVAADPDSAPLGTLEELRQRYKLRLPQNPK